jgi:hypothetical protein
MVETNVRGLIPNEDPLPSLRRGDPGGRVGKLKNGSLSQKASRPIRYQVSPLPHLIKPLPNQPTIMKGNN